MSIRCTVESAFFIAWSFLEKSGELGPPDASAIIILDAIEAQLKTGERRPLMLGNRAIDAYRRTIIRPQSPSEALTPSTRDHIRPELGTSCAPSALTSRQGNDGV